MAQANKDLFNVTNKFGFLVVSDSDDEDAAWEKPKKTAKLPGQAKKKVQNKPAAPKNASSVVGFATVSADNIITNQPTAGQGLSKNAKRRAAAKKKKLAEEAANTPEPEVVETPPQSEEQVFQKQLEEAISLSKVVSKKVPKITEDSNKSEDTKPKKKKKKSAPAEKIEKAKEEEEDEEEEEEEEDLFGPVVDEIKDVIKRISKDDEIPITDIPIDNNQLLRKRAIELQEINSEFKLKLNSLLRVGYKYKRKYQKEKSTSKLLTKVLTRCESSKKADMVKSILQHEETEEMLTRQVEELTEDLEKERTKLFTLQGDKKGVKKVSISETS